MSPFSSSMTLHTTSSNIFLEWGWTLFQSSLVEWARKIRTSRPNYLYKIRGISNPCVKLEATHPISRSSGHVVHTDFCVMQVYYKVWNNSSHRFCHCPWAWVSKSMWPLSIIFFCFTNVILVFSVLRSTWELRFRALGGSPSYWAVSKVHRLHLKDVVIYNL
jgi:hypothetical protein